MTRATRMIFSIRLLVLAPLLVGCGPVQADPIPTPAAAQSRAPLGQVVSEIGNNVWVVYQDSRGHHWFGTDGAGVIRYDGKTLTRYSADHGLPNDRIREIKEDKVGNIFISTLEGICKFDGEQFTLLRVVEDDNAWRLHPDDLWFKGATNTHGPYRYDGKTLYLLKFPKSYLEDQINREFPRSVVSPYSIYTIYQDTKGHLWFGTQHLGACRYDGKTHTWIYERHLSEAEDGGSFGIRTIAEDKAGKFWICSNQYRYTVKPGTREGTQMVADYSRELGISHTNIQQGYKPTFFESMTRDNEGNLWMSSNATGVWRYDGKEMKHFPVETGKSWLISVTLDREGHIWLGTDSAGVFRFDGHGFKKFEPLLQTAK